MTFTEHTDTPALVKRWPYGFQHIGEHDPLFDYLSGYASELQQIDVFIDELYEQRFLESATGHELEKLAGEVGVTRDDGETDESLRYRARLRKAVAASDGTPSDIEVILQIAFSEETLGEINVTHSPGAPVTQFNIPGNEIDNIPISRAEFESELERAFPAGYGVVVARSDTWLLGESGAQGVGNGGLI